MAFLRTLFWIVLTVVLVVFAVHNWLPVQILLFGNLVWETKLPVPMLMAFLLGFVPLYAWHRLMRWHEYKKRVAAERALAAAIVAPSSSSAPAPVTEGTLNPAQAD